MNERVDSQVYLSYPERGGKGGEASNGWPKAGVVESRKFCGVRKKKSVFFALLKHAFVRNFQKSFQNHFQKGEKKRRKVPFLGCFFIKNRTKINFFSLIISKIVKKCKKSFERYCQIKKR